MTIFNQASIVGAAVTALTLAMPATAQSVTMTFGHAGPATAESDDQIAVTAFKDFVEKELGGDIAVQIFPAQQLGDSREMTEQISSGALNAAHVPVVFLSSFVPELSIVELPYLLDSEKHARAFMGGPIRDFLSEKIGAAVPNVAVGSLSNTGNFRSFYTTVAINSLADMAGVKIRTVPSPLAIEFVKQLGAEPVPMGFADVYPSLQTGLIQGTKNAAIDIVPNKMDEVIKHAFIDQHSYLLGGNLVSSDFMASLTEEQREIVLKGFDLMSEVQTDYNEAFEAEARATFEENGGTIVVPDSATLSEFRKSHETMIDWFVGEFGTSGQEWVDVFVREADASRP